MRLSRLVLLVVFSAFATCASAQHPMPDFSGWNKTVDHTTSYLSNSKQVEVRDVHFDFVNKERTETFLVIVFYSPNTTKAWFSVFVHEYLNKAPEVYLYETNKNGVWVFVEDVSKSNLEAVLKKYNLVEVK